MEDRSCQVPGTLWIVPQGHNIEIFEPLKILYIHVIPTNVTYEVLLDIDIPMGDVYEVMTGVLTRCKPPEDQEETMYSLYWKKSIVNTIGEEVQTTEFPSGATFLMTDGDTQLPTYHSGKLWQCKSCPDSFDSFKNLNKHVQRKNHKIRKFGQNINWGIVIAPQQNVEVPKNHRRQMMGDAIKEPETFLNKFVPDDKDLKWELEVFRPTVVKRSNKWKSQKEKLDPDFVNSILKGTDDIPKDCYRQMPGTWNSYRPQLHRILICYQGVKKRPLHYRDFFAFGKSNLVNLSEPEQFLDNWKGATPEMKKKWLGAHNMLQILVRSAALSAQGLEEFENSHKDSHDAVTKGLADQDLFLKNLDRITQQIKVKQLWSTYKIHADAKRKHAEELKEKLEDCTNKKGDPKLKEKVDKFLASNFVIKAEKDLLDSAANNKKLTDQEFGNGTEFLVTRIQIFSGGRREATDLTVEEWDNRVTDEDGSTTIDRSFTKLEGTLSTFIHLDPVETFLVLAYEIAKHNQFPWLYLEERRHLQSFFCTSSGKAYFPGQKGNASHLTAWNKITDSNHVPTDFRTNMANWSITTDHVTRANTAFVCAHSVEIQTKVYAKTKNKQKEGIKVLERYRDEELGRPDRKSTMGRLDFFSLKLPPELEEMQRRLRIDSYDKTLNKALRVESELQMDQHTEKPHCPATDASKASLLEIIADERSSEVPVSCDFGFLADSLLMRKKGKRKSYVSNKEITEAIMCVIDSPRFAENPSAISLKNILIMAASAKLSDEVEMLEELVVEKWVQQIENLGRESATLTCYRFKAAFVSLAKIAKNERTYSVGNLSIVRDVRKMQSARKKLCREYQTIQELEQQKKTQAMDKTKILIESPATPNRASPRLVEKTPKTKSPIISRKRPHSAGKTVAKELNFSTPPPSKKTANEETIEPQSSQTPSPIKVNITGANRKPNWTRRERTILLEHILKNMENPTVVRGTGQGKKDLKLNVLPKVSPNLVENPDGSRTLDDLVAQYYRYVNLLLLDYLPI